MTLTRDAAQALSGSALNIDELVVAKGSQRVSVCIPARDEAETVGHVVDVAVKLSRQGIVDEVVLADDGSRDSTGAVAAAAGARVVRTRNGPGKGQALRAAVLATTGDILVFVDADVTNFTCHFITEVMRPLLCDPNIHLAKATYHRPLAGRADEGGRVTELLARPLLRRFFPELAGIGQPLAGECAIRRSMLEGVNLSDGYGIEIGLLIDVFRIEGRSAIIDVDLGERIHRNHALHDLQPHADAVLATVVSRVDQCWPLRPSAHAAESALQGP